MDGSLIVWNKIHELRSSFSIYSNDVPLKEVFIGFDDKIYVLDEKN